MKKVVYNVTRYRKDELIKISGLGFLIVTNYKSEWKNLVVTENGIHYAFAYVWNKDDDFCSEFGTIGVRSMGGGIMRVA